jgi:thiol-disulfide isomerase/thioredoxin
VKRGISAIVLGLVTALLVTPAPAYYSSTWFEDADGHASATRQWKTMNAPMLVYFRTDWCPYCRSFDELLEEREVRTRLAGVIKVRINPEHGEDAKKLFKEEYGGSGYPTVFLYPAGGGPREMISAKGPAKRFLAQLGD